MDSLYKLIKLTKPIRSNDSKFYQAGSTIKIAVDKDGLPCEGFWRQRFLENETEKFFVDVNNDGLNIKGAK